MCIYCLKNNTFRFAPAFWKACLSFSVYCSPYLEPEASLLQSWISKTMENGDLGVNSPWRPLVMIFLGDVEGIVMSWQAEFFTQWLHFSLCVGDSVEYSVWCWVGWVDTFPFTTNLANIFTPLHILQWYVWFYIHMIHITFLKTRIS